MAAYYNEIDPFAAAWLRELIKGGHIAPGDVDERSIVDVRPADLAGYEQCHFFAGIGGWSAALRLAGWSDDRACWTGSCPCQPFSAAGQGRGKDDSRHLWPQFRRLIRQCRPAVVFGEQVASKAGRVWLSAVFADLEALAYRPAGADLCGPSVGSFDIRQRLWFVADTDRERGGRHARTVLGAEREAERRVRCLADGTQPCGAVGRLADGNRSRPTRTRADRHESYAQPNLWNDVGGSGEVSGMAYSQEHRRGQGSADDARGRERTESEGTGVGLTDYRGRRGPINSPVALLTEADILGALAHACSAGPEEQQRGRIKPSGSPAADFWRDVEWLPCSDGKWRPTQPGLFPLAHGVRGRMVVRRTSQQAEAEIQEHWYSRTGALRGFGNAIKPQVAAAFIQAYRDVMEAA